MSAPHNPKSPATDAEMLPQEMPPAVMRWTAALLIALFLVIGVAVVAVRLPESVRCPFVLVPEKGADPIQAPLVAVVETVKVADGREVKEGEELFLLRSDEIRTWQTQLKESEEDLRALQKRSARLDEFSEADLNIKAEELKQVEREVVFRQKHLDTSRDFLERNRKLAAEKLLSQVELLQCELQVAESEKDLNVAQRTVQQVTLQRQQLETERTRRHTEEEAQTEKLKVGIEALKRQLANCAGDCMSVRAPYHAVVISVAHHNAGGVVLKGQDLCQLARAEGEPQARLTLQEAGLAKLAAGQKVRLFFEAFPYERYGAVSGKLEWISQAAVASSETQGFTARATLDKAALKVSGKECPLRAGMRGEAHIVVGSRTLLEYAFEPLHQLREQMRP